MSSRLVEPTGLSSPFSRKRRSMACVSIGNSPTSSAGPAAFGVNADAVGALAATCQALGATFVHFSTDYVFDGRKTTPYLEDDPPSPISVYAESKVADERLARERCERAFVFRVCGLFGVGRSTALGRANFVETMLGLAAILSGSGALDLRARATQRAHGRNNDVARRA